MSVLTFEITSQSIISRLPELLRQLWVTKASQVCNYNELKALPDHLLLDIGVDPAMCLSMSRVKSQDRISHTVVPQQQPSAQTPNRDGCYLRWPKSGDIAPSLLLEPISPGSCNIDHAHRPDD